MFEKLQGIGGGVGSITFPQILQVFCSAVYSFGWVLVVASRQDVSKPTLLKPHPFLPTGTLPSPRACQRLLLYTHNDTDYSGIFLPVRPGERGARSCLSSRAENEALRLQEGRLLPWCDENTRQGEGGREAGTALAESHGGEVMTSQSFAEFPPSET